MPKTLLGAFLTFRLKQLFRVIREIGVLRVVFMSTIIFILLFQVIRSLSNYHPLYVPVFYLLITTPLHIFRKDFVFIFQLDLSKRLIFAAEYNLAVIPLSLIAAVSGLLWIIPIGHIVSTITAFLPGIYLREYQSKNRRVVNWIPFRLFEWRFLFRKHFYMALLSYGIGLLLSFSVYTLPVFLFYWMAFIAYAFNTIEPKEVIEEYGERSAFLRQKIKIHSLFFHALFVPQYCLFLLFHFQFWYVWVYLFLFAQMVIMFCIYFKYAHAAYARKIVANQVPVMLFISLTLFLPPVSILILYRYQKRANAEIQT